MRFLKKDIILRLGLLGIVFNLLGCNGSNSNSSSIPEQKEKFVSASIVDDYSLIDINDEQLKHKVKLLDKIRLSENYEVIISSIESLNKNKACKIIERDFDGFSIEGIEPLVCDYQYQIRLKSENNNVKLTGDTTGYTRVLMSNNPESSKLIPFGVVAYQNKPTVIDIEEELSKVGDTTSLDDYVINDDIVVTPSDSSSIISVDSSTHKITYTPSDSFSGNEQISYSLTNKSGDKVLAGSFVVTVAAEIINGIDIDEKIEIGGADSAEVNVEKVIDISNYVHNVDDDYQLIYVSAFGAKVELNSPTDPQNKKFKFQANMLGDYYVNVIVSDHRGGYDVGLVKVNVTDPNGVGNWPSIWNGLLYFNAPLTTVDALTDNIAATSSYFDSALGYWIAAFDYNMAKDYCNTIGRLPTVEELKNLYTEKSPGIRGWPIEKVYWSSDLNTVVNLADGSDSASKPNTAYYVTCVGDGDFKIDTKESTVTDIVADEMDTATIVAKISFNGSPVEGETVNLVLSDSKAVIDTPQVMSDSNGEAKFSLSSRTAETFIATATYDTPITRDLISRDITVSFIGDAKTATLDQSTTVDNVSIYSQEAEVTASLIDINNNTVPKEVVSFSSFATSVTVTPATTETNTDGKQVAKIKWTDTTIPLNDQTVEVFSTYIRPGETVPMTASSLVRFLVAKFTELKTIVNNESIDGGINIVRAIIKDPSDNPKSDVDVNFKSNSDLCWIDGKDATTVPVTIASDSNGHANANISFKGVPEDYPKGYNCSIEATYGNTVKSNIVNFASYVCGGINDKTTNPDGNCVKVASYPSMTSNKLVTAAFGESFWKTLKNKTGFNSYVNATDGVEFTKGHYGFIIGGDSKHRNDEFRAGNALCKAYNDLKLAGRTNWTPFAKTVGDTSLIYKEIGPMSLYNWPIQKGYSVERYFQKQGAWRLRSFSLETGTDPSPTSSIFKNYITCYSPN
ncbi:TPA: Ig-like domain-containing protein [Photobacterium damselae]